MTQDDWVRKFGVKYATPTKIESGVIKTLSALMVEKIAKALNVDIENLLK